MTNKIAWAAVLAIGALTIPAQTAYAPEPEPIIQAVEVKAPPEKTFETEITRLAIKYGQSEKLARKIIHCEARQYGSGAEHKNYDKQGVHWSTDWGWWQINDYYNEAPAAKRGFNIYDKWDNLEFGFIMLKEQGTQPWLASSACWRVG